MPFHAMTPPSRCSGGGSGGHSRRDDAAVPIDHVDVQLGLHVHVACGADAAEKRERLVIAAEEHVLAVVHALAGGRIGERGRPAAERRPRLEHEHADAALGQRRGGAEAGEAAADDDDVNGSMPNAQCLTLESVGFGTGARRRMPISVCSQMRSAMSARCGRGTRMRRLNTS